MRPEPVLTHTQGMRLSRDFDAWMVDQGWSKATRLGRRKTVAHAASYISLKFHRPLWMANTDQLRVYLSSRPANPTTRNKVRADLDSFWRFLIEIKVRKTNPISGIPRLREPMYLPRPISKADARTLLKCAEAVSPRAVVVVSLLLYTGMRRNEACFLPWSAIDFDARRIRVFGKFSKERVVPIPRSLNDVLRTWRVANPEDVWVFPSGYKLGEPMNPMTLWRDLHLSAQIAGIVVSPHRCRHTYATELLEEDVDIRVISKLLGHVNLGTTQRYTEVSVNKLQRDVGKLDFS